MEYLISVIEKYRLETEEAAAEFIENAKNNPSYTLVKYNCEYKCRKQKGEIVDEWYTVTLVKSFNDEKDPLDKFQISYTTSAQGVMINNGSKV